MRRPQVPRSRAQELTRERHGDLLRRLLRRLAGDGEAAEDLAQQTFVKAWKALPQRWALGAAQRVPNVRRSLRTAARTILAMRQTKQRRIILDLIRRADDHPTAAQVYERARRALPGLGYATVYRSLRALAAEGLIREVRVGGVAQYDGRSDRHDHVVCRRCGRMADVVVPLPAETVAALAERTGFRIEEHHTELAGICPECA